MTKGAVMPLCERGQSRFRPDKRASSTVGGQGSHFEFSCWPIGAFPPLPRRWSRPLSAAAVTQHGSARCPVSDGHRHRSGCCHSCTTRREATDLQDVPVAAHQPPLRAGRQYQLDDNAPRVPHRTIRHSLLRINGWPQKRKGKKEERMSKACVGVCMFCEREQSQAHKRCIVA